MTNIIEVKGIGRVVYIFDNVTTKIKESFPDSFEEFVKLILDTAIERASAFGGKGDLAMSMAMEIDRQSLTGIIGPTAKHGPMVSFPTQGHWVNASVEVAQGIWRFVKWHPGTPGNPYLEESLEDSAPRLPDIIRPYIADKWIKLDQESKSFEMSEGGG